MIQRKPSRLNDTIFHPQETAADFLVAHNRVKRASNICFTIRQIIDGISSVFSAVLGWAENILNAIISRIPGINSLPGLPSFNFNFNFLNALSWPSINLDLLDFNVNLNFLNFNFPTYNGVCDLLGRK